MNVVPSGTLAGRLMPRHLLRKEFNPDPLPFPLLHVETTWKFR